MSLLKGLTLLLLLVLCHPQSFCSVYCSSCSGSGSNSYNTNCQDCRASFTQTGSSCDPDMTKYTTYLQYATNELSLSDGSTGGCGGAFSSAVPGQFYAGRVIQIYNNAAMNPYFLVRVLAGAFFIDKWKSNDNIAVKINTVSKGWRSYTKAWTVGGGNNLCTGSTREKYGTIDTGDYGVGTLTSLVVTIEASQCDGCSGFGCDCRWMVPDIILLWTQCHPYCLKCSGINNNQCSACANDTMLGIQYKLTQTTCDENCSALWFRVSPNLCAKCNSNCTVCDTIATNCSECATGYIFLPLNNTCPKSCPLGYYADTTFSPAQCSACYNTCLICSNYPTPCTKCVTGNYLYMSDCIAACPAPLIPNNNAWTCEDCNTYCVGLTVSFYQPKGMNGLSALYIDMNFTNAIDFTTFPMSTFQTISFASSQYSTSMFNITYTPTTSMAYRITLVPLGYAFISNQTVTVETMALPATKHTSTDGRPFKDEDYGVVKNLTWTYVKPPDMTSTQQSIVSMMSSFSTEINSALSQPGLQEVKKLGFTMLLMNSLQITSCLLLLNMILPQNLYEGIRFFASFIFFDVPPWEAQSQESKLFVYPPISSLARRRMLQTNTTTVLDEFRFRRTGFTNMFIFDCYVQILTILMCYAVLIGSICLAKRSKKFKQVLPYLYTILTALHEIALMYFSLTIMFEFYYFQTSMPIRWVSAIVCMVVTVYYLFYHVHIYYELMEFPLLEPKSPRFKELIDKYGNMLRNIRCQNPRLDKGCIPARGFFRPTNYHVLSYIKKMLMMATFPLFYSSGQIALIILSIIQLGQIIRFIATWPFAKRWRNIVRLVLQFTLLSIFLVVFGIQQISTTIYGPSPQAEQVRLYFNVGWIGFGLVLFFNLGFLILTIYDVYSRYQSSNQEMIQENRRVFYFDKLKELEEKNEATVGAAAEYVKKGNLNKRMYQKLPDVDLRIEYYRICQEDQDHYVIEVNNVMEACMQSEFNYKPDENNVQVIRRLQGTWKVGRGFHYVFQAVHGCFERYSDHGLPVVVKTFSTIEQKKHQFGQKIDLQLNKMVHQLEIETQKGKTKTIKNLGLLPGFPIPEDLLLGLKGHRPNSSAMVSSYMPIPTEY